MDEKIINLTLHPLNIFKDGKLIKEIPSSGIVRAEEISEETPIKILGVTVVKKRFGKIINLPDSKEGVWYYVSRIVLNALPNRKDLVTSSKLVRNEKGQIIGIEEFSIN